MTKTRLDWAAIRALNGAQSAGFEELCAQLARSVSPASFRFVRKGTPDGGVECYTVAPDGSEWGWQAKYFRSALGDSQWAEVDDSVVTALEKHPKLRRYYVCVPRDLSDGRIDRADDAKGAGGASGGASAPKKRRLSSEQDRWDRHAQKWAVLAAEKGMSVEFVYWGSSELLDMLAEPQHIGRVRFWFDVRGFDAEWFDSRLKEALAAAGPRYTPEIHVALPIAAEFEAFGRTATYFDGLKAKARELRKKLHTFEWEEPKTPDKSGFESPLAGHVAQHCKDLIGALAAMTAEAIGELPFVDLGARAMSFFGVAEELSEWLSQREQAHDEEERKKEQPASSGYRRNPFADRRHRLFGLQREVRDMKDAFDHALRLASGQLMLLVGDAGTGKTHLLCDVARKRLGEGRPTVLLMGQRFLSVEDPWFQALRQMDLDGMQAEELIGALEAAAQSAGCRALVMVDALNEGTGDRVWPSHLAAFLVRLERSPWIGVVLSVRASYENLIVPEDVRTRAVGVTHHGFAEHEYDAAKAFFGYYGIELPSTPLLAPEFRNPLFLKVLCRGLKDGGQRRVPKGLHGITMVFQQFLGAINDRLATVLSFNPSKKLVWKAVEAIAERLVATGERWLPAAEAEALVDALLPGRDFDRSLYRALVSEGVLTEDAMIRGDIPSTAVTYVAYERLADHLVARFLLDQHLDPSDPKAAFAAAGPLGFLGDDKRYVPSGLLEAFCVQVPERIKHELPLLSDPIKERYGIGDAFRQSIIWRATNAFSKETRKCLNALIVTQHDVHDTFDMILTTAIVSGHPFNADRLHDVLRRKPMPERDAWWSVYLHKEWGNRGPLDRIVDWSRSIAPAESLADETVELCATVLAWMLTTSNRFLRDRATKGLVTLLSGRFAVAERLVERFAKVDDPYVTERVLAAAYGISMLSHDKEGVGLLARRVYREVFAEGAPPPRILVRDYARGVVERASYLGASLDLDLARIRPPYGSPWPKIPTEEELKPFLSDRPKTSYEGGDPEWSRNAIVFSVMHWDFARYIIGTNSNSSNWLSLKLAGPPWQPPPTRQEALLSFEADLSKKEGEAWHRHKDLTAALDKARGDFVRGWLEVLSDDELKALAGPKGRKSIEKKMAAARPPSLTSLAEEHARSEADLATTLTARHRKALKAALAANLYASEPPRFDLKLIQRYVLWRVFDLGWTTERFGEFDRFAIRHEGRGEQKAERIGKKYQWIAYHEAMALVADNFQYRERYREEGRAYDGSWQESFRDIDPSCALPAKPGGTSWDGHQAAWWGAARYDVWPETAQYGEWLIRYDDLPSMGSLLTSADPVDGSRWLNADAYLAWKQPTPPDVESSDVERGELWYHATGYLIREKDADAFLGWAENVDFWGRWMPMTQEVYGMFLGEHAWSSAAQHFQTPYRGDEGWVRPREDCPVEIRAMALEYHKETGADGSVDESYNLRLPCSDLLKGMSLQWDGQGADFRDRQGRLIVTDPAAHADGPTGLLMRMDALGEFLTREKLVVCWACLGEKRVLARDLDPAYRGALRATGAYLLRNGALKGFTKYIEDDGRTPGGKQVALIRDDASAE